MAASVRLHITEMPLGPPAPPPGIRRHRATQRMLHREPLSEQQVESWRHCLHGHTSERDDVCIVCQGWGGFGTSYAQEAGCGAAHGS